MSEVTLRDVLMLLTERMDRLDENQIRLAENQQELIEATNHKVDVVIQTTTERLDSLTEQLLTTVAGQAMRSKIFWGAVAGLITVFMPVVLDHWRMLIERITLTF